MHFTAGIGLTSWLSFVMFNCIFVTFPCGILSQVWYLIVSISDLCHLSYFHIKPVQSCAPNRHMKPVEKNVVNVKAV